MSEYEGFSKQNLIDRRDALVTEYGDLTKERMNILAEIICIEEELKKETKQ